VSDVINADERLRIKGLSASACSLWQSYPFISQQCSIIGRETDGLHFIPVQRLSRPTLSPHFWCDHFCVGRFGMWLLWTFTVAILVWFVAVLVMAVFVCGRFDVIRKLCDILVKDL